MRMEDLDTPALILYLDGLGFSRGHLTQRIDAGLNDMRQGDGVHFQLRLLRLGFAEIQDIIDETQEHIPRGFNMGQSFPVFGFQVILFKEHVRKSQDSVER